MSIYRKLLAVQSCGIHITKNATANIAGRSYKYADLPSVLDSVRPALTSAGLVLIQSVDGPDLVTRIIDSDSAESVESRFHLGLESASWHQIGSGISYARRYAVLGLLGLAADDDDDAVSTIPDRPAPASNHQLGDCHHCGEALSIGPKTGKPYCKPCFLAKRNGYAALTETSR